ncbi:heavy metal transporter [Streptomyces sp. TRM S81-3]|uniref:Heavy metal transporter n=1 Tax=Streptomyces griseicoloratus TaxID=2752516 RepID=A0A926KYM1_9ACTN|nr:heavy metal transporter [Streptomyces griseicoloratus]MBD0419265.1 heavy metal transporter [Streptomyces griseicoloratus]
MLQPSPPRKRRGRLLRSGAAFVVLLAVAGYVTVQYVTGGTGAPGCKVVSDEGDGAAYEFTPEQAVNAATITAVGTARDLPERAVTIALATALQESALRNIDYGDRDSLGLFQQRPSQGWGTPEEIMDPAYAAGKFYDHLVEVPGYTRLPLTVAAQRVQRSGFPQAYAKHEPDATLLAAALTGRSAATLTCAGRPGASRAEGPDAVRDALVRDFGRDVLQPVGATEGGPAKAAPTATPSPGAGASGGSDGRTVTLPVTAGSDPDAAPDTRRRGWQLAHWAVANASALRIERVSYAGREWTAGNTDSRWRPTGADGAAGAERAAGPVRITTAR